MKLRDRPGYGWLVLGTFSLNYSVVIISIMTLGLLLPQISEDLSLSPSQQGWLASSILFGNLIFEIPLNWWLSRYRPWRVTSVTFGAAALFMAFNAWAPTFAVLLGARIGLGAIYLSSQAPRTLVILQWIPRKYISLANGVLFSAIDGLIGIGFVVIPLLMVWLGGWRATLYAWAIGAIVAAGLWFFLGGDRMTPEYTERMRSQAKSPLRGLFKYREPWIMGFGMSGAMIGRTAFSTFWPTYVKDEYGIAVTSAGIVIGLISIASSPAQLALAAFPFFSRHTPTVLAVCGLGLSTTYAGLLITNSLPILFLLGIVNGLAFSFFPIMITTLYRLPGIKPREIAVTVGFIFTLIWGGAAIGPLTVGFVQEATDNLALALLISTFGPLALTAAGAALSGRGRSMMDTIPVPAPGRR